MKKRVLTMLCALVASAMSVWADGVTFSPLQYEQLPSMQTPRRGHACFVTPAGDIVVVGGHTTDFELTTSAERLHDGAWESISINNPHDGGACVALPDGRFLICGGFGNRWGMGQSTVCDIYDPATNTFSSTGDMNTARAFCAGVATGVDNNVLVSGNWYNYDTTFELWNGSTWSSFGNKQVELNNPFMVSAGGGIVYVFGNKNNYANTLPVAVWKVDTNNKTAEEVSETGLEDYDLIHGDFFAVQTTSGEFFLLGNKEDFTHLLCFNPATAQATDLGLLPNAVPSSTNKVNYSPGIVVNESRQEAYVIGGFQNIDGTFTLVVINYNMQTKTMSAYYGEQLPCSYNYGAYTLEPATGNIIFTGGSYTEDGQANFNIVSNCISVKPYAEETPQGSDILVYEFNETDKTATVVQRQVWAQLDEYHGTMVNSYYGDIVIPEKVNGYTVTAIADFAFWKDYELGISSVVIPKTVKNIGSFAFYNCNLLRELTIPATVEYIGQQIIAGSGVQEVTIEDSDMPLTGYVISPLLDSPQLTKIYVGRDINLTNPETTYEYGPFTWSGTITDLTYGPQVTRLHNNECWSAGALQRVTFLTDKVTVLPEHAFSSCSNLVNIQLPAKLERIEDCGIFGSQVLKSVTLPATLRYLGQQGLDNPALETIYIQATTPPTTKEGCAYFDSDVLANCKLYVPNGTQEAYQTARIWNEFQHIIGMDYTGISTVGASAKVNKLHTLDGRRVENPAKGLYIMNGKKVVIK